ncbi:hypothetical protein [Kordiimonas pumila]|uniref:DUF4231 domain-containing protein n=1 Tax=Kordiimonas pumila TaxID=2161677 RepID=A0ABV7D3U6_9PROT|nr:hypothetical protein [Kordiimonas pumila]
MELLFEREQGSREFGGVYFKLIGKLEFGEEEQELIKRYKFDQAVLIESYQPKLLQQSALRGLGVLVLSWLLYFFMFEAGNFALILAVITGGGFGYWYYHQNRQTIYVRDLMHGRHFLCESVVELARKEAWLELICSFLRQVMESAKHWDGATHVPIEALPKDEAKQIIIKGI